MNQHLYRRKKLLALSAITCTLLVGCSDSDSAKSYTSTITYTDYGVPHIQAEDYGSLGYGIGYAHARENLCTLSEQIMKLKSQKSRFFGAGDDDENLLSDIGYKALDYPAEAASLMDTVDDTSLELIEGYVAGFNRSLDERSGPQDYPSPCRGEEWVTPITAVDLLAYHLDLAGLASSRNFLSAMAAAQPPSATVAAFDSVQLDAKQVFTSEGIGSNGWALGEDRTEGGKSALIGNPHFPWDGELRFFEQHLTIPGELDVSGVGMIGLPVVAIGFNENLGWTHTVSQSKRFTLYRLTLDENNPLRYKFDDDATEEVEYREMTSKNVTVTVKQEDGSFEDVVRTVYFSHLGPMIDLSSLSPLLAWSNTNAVTFRDANAGNIRILPQWLAMGKASSREEFFKAFEDHQGLPWVNTIMIADDGTASYIDGTQVPQLSEAGENEVELLAGLELFAPIWQDGAGQVLLTGDNTSKEWVDSGDAGAPGLVPFSKAPKQTRRDYVFNANSSHWLTNLDEPLEGYSLIYGPEGTVRSPRTRYNAELISDMSGSGLAGADNKFSLDELKAVLTHNGSLFGGAFKGELVQRCTDYSSIQIEGEAFDLTPACNALSAWDGAYNVESTGAHVMREFLKEFEVSGHRNLSNDLFETPFDPNNPATTPAGLKAIDSSNVDADPVLLALSAAAKRLTDAGIALNAELGDIQYVIKAEGSERIPVSGANSYEGVFNMTETVAPSRSTSVLANVVTGTPRSDSPLTDLDEDGNGSTAAYRINYGTSFVLALMYGDNGPQAQMFLSYGQSHDPESEFFEDQTRKFGELEWRDVVFKAEDVQAQAVETINLKGK